MSIPHWWMELQSRDQSRMIHLPKICSQFQLSPDEILYAMAQHSYREKLIAEDNHSGIVHQTWKDTCGPEPDQLVALAHQYQIIAQNIHFTWSRVRDLREQLQELSHHIHCNLYVNGPEAKGLLPHADSCPVIVIQLAGEKQWFFRNQIGPKMRPGDILWIPEGLGHHATAVADPSLPLKDQLSFHLTCGLRKSIHEGWTKQHTEISLPDRSDLWPMSDGVFVPRQWNTAPENSERKDIEDKLHHYGQQHPHISIHLRGSLLERISPHPGADLDLIILAPRDEFSTHKIGVKDALEHSTRMLDLHLLDPKEGIDRWGQLLLGCMTLQISGPKHTWASIPIDQGTPQYMWKMLGLHRIPVKFPPHGRLRVQVVKKLLRSIGIIRLITHREFSRNLRRCLIWCKELDPKLYNDFYAIYQSLDGDKKIYTQGDHATNYPTKAWSERLIDLAQQAGIHTNKSTL